MAIRHSVHRLAVAPLICFFATGFAARQGGALAGLTEQIDSEPLSVGGDSISSAFPFTTVYDSGWFALGPRPDPLSVSFDHLLGGDADDYVVTLECKDDAPLATYDCVDQQFNVNAHWYALTSSSIRVWAAGGSRPDEIRIRIHTEVPARDSDWIPLLSRPDPIPVPYNHNLFGDPDDYLLSLECRDDSALGVYGCIGFPFNAHANWYDLTNTSVEVWVQSGSMPDDVRVRLFLAEPDYDSGWFVIGARPDPLAVSFDHNLGGDPDSYLVDLECKDSSALNTYDCTNFNFFVTAHWYDLNDTSVKVWVPGAPIPDEIRVRIWTGENLIFADGFESGDTSAWSLTQ